MINPLLQKWNTPYETPPFNDIRIEHFKPAIEETIRLAAEEVRVITENRQPPDFENTIVALDLSGERLGDLTSLLFNLNSAETSKELQAATLEISPLLTRFANDITLNEKLWERIRTIYESRNITGLNTEQMMLLEKSHRSFVFGGAGLSDEKKSRFREISEELSVLSVKFDENILDDTNEFELLLTDGNELSGLPQSIIAMASKEAGSRKKEGWIFTLHFPSYVPFMKYSDNRHLREKMLKAYSSRSFHNDSHDNQALAVQLANLRLELAIILGFRNFAEMTLVDRMADSTAKVETFLEELHLAAAPAARRDYDSLAKFASESGFRNKLERWDWSYYSEKLQKAKFDIDDELLKPYFLLENTQKAIFDLAGTLYGIRFSPNDRIQVYHPEVKTWEVFDRDGTFLAILYIDYFPRPGKLGGAWMTCYRDQRVAGGKDTRPLVSIVANFSRPADTQPSLLTFNEVTTFLHEFGHSLHGMLTRCTYEGLSGTSVARDFVELPSQFMENYAYEKEWLSSWAVHYKTGKKLPDEFIIKLKALTSYNEGYACNRQLGFGFLDMAWHTITAPVTGNVTDFETAAVSGTELFPPIEGTNMSVSFSHIFSGGYAAGYYGYKWAEVLDADAFKHFRESGIFDRETAASFRKNILERGGSDKPAALYKKFRGQDPTIEAFLERSGLK